MSDWAFTGIGAAAGLVAFAFSHWQASRPPTPGRARMLPWTALSLIAALWTLMMIVHAVNLLGVTTGRP
jgi:hypothetical protein